jgi:hypothetical protein
MMVTKHARTAFILCFLALFPGLPAAGQQDSPQETSSDHITYIPLAMQQHDSSFTWLEASSVDLEPQPSSTPLAVIDRQGRLHLLWDTWDSPRFVYHTVQTRSGWTAPAPVSASNGISSIMYEPYVDADGIIHLLWKNWLGTGIDKPYRLLYSSFDGSRWSSEEVVAQMAEMPSGVVHSGARGEVQVTYSFGTIPIRIFYTLRSGSGWNTAIEVTPLRDLLLILLGYYQVWGDNQGGIHVYEIPHFSDKANYFFWRDGSWQVRDRLLEGRLSDRKIQLDEINNLHMSWTGDVPVPGGQVNGVYHQCLEDNRVFAPQEIPSGGQAVSGSVIRAWDQRSQTGLAWREADGKFKLGTWQGCNYLAQRVVPFPADLHLELASLAMSAAPSKLCAVARVLYINTYVASCAEIR